MNTPTAGKRPGWLHGYWPLVMIVLIVVAPGMLAMLVYLSGWRPDIIKVHGELQDPPQVIVWPPLKQATKEGLSSWRFDKKTQNQWTITYLAPDACQQACIRSLYRLRAIDIGQGKHSLRVSRVVITSNTNNAQVWVKSDPGLTSLITDSLSWQDMLAQLGNGIAIIDAQGRIVLRYSPNAKLNTIKRELTKLMKVN